MFAKPYKHKSNNTLKNSEKKHLAQRVQDEFPSASEEQARELVPVKGSCVCMKVVLHSGDLVSVYCVDGEPMLVETAGGLVPTVCALWRVPALVPLLNIHTPVFSKVQGGAPLYLPGVSLPTGGAGFPVFQCGTVVAARTQDNAAACLVGRAAMSSADMLLRASGVCLDTLHFYGDQLCKDNKFNWIERPKLTPADTGPDCTLQLTADIQQLSLQRPQDPWPALGQQWPALGRAAPAPAPVPAPAAHKPRLIVEKVNKNDEGSGEEPDDSVMTESSQVEEQIPTDMDGLLKWCLLSFIKLHGKTVELPLKTNLFYKNHLHPLCPPDRTIDVKKSSYKKFSKFMEAMQTEGLVESRELEAGVSSLVALCAAHPLVRAHRPPPHRPAPAPAPPRTAPPYSPPTVREVYCVTAAVQPLFAPLRKGTALSSSEIRASVERYVKTKGLTSPAVKGAVTLDPVLAAVLGKPEQESASWEAVTSGVRARMTASTQMTFADGSARLTKTALQPVTMRVVSRSGNKKVTLVSNLESFGFDLSALAGASQSGAAATCGVTRSPGARADQLMLQGDQTHFVAKLLIEKYGLPKKFLEGADKALNKKK